MSEILIYTRIYTLVRAARIPFVIAKSIDNSFFNVPMKKKKKKSLFLRYFILFIRLYAFDFMILI